MIQNIMICVWLFIKAMASANTNFINYFPLNQAKEHGRKLESSVAGTSGVTADYTCDLDYEINYDKMVLDDDYNGAEYKYLNKVS